MQVPTLNVRFERDELRRKPDMNTFRMKVKRVVAFVVVLTALVATYYFYSRHYRPSLMTDEVWSNADQANDNRKINLLIESKPKIKVSARKQSGNTFQLFRGLGDDQVDPDLGNVGHFDAEEENGDDFTDFDDDGGGNGGGQSENMLATSDRPHGDTFERPSGSSTEAGEVGYASREEGDGGDGPQHAELEKRLQQQEELIHQQAKVLQQLQEKLLNNFQPHAPQQGHFPKENFPPRLPGDSPPGNIPQQRDFQQGNIPPRENLPQQGNFPQQKENVPLQQPPLNPAVADAGRMFAEARNKAPGQIFPDGHGPPAQPDNRVGAAPGLDSQNDLVDAEKLFEQARMKGQQMPAVARQNDFNRQQVLAPWNPAGINTGNRGLDNPSHNVGVGHSQRGQNPGWDREWAVAAPKNDRGAGDAINRDGAFGQAGQQNDIGMAANEGGAKLIGLNAADDKGIQNFPNKEQDLQPFNQFQNKVPVKPPLINLHVYDLKQAPSGTFDCVPMTLSVHTRDICVHSGGKDTGQSHQIAMYGKWEELEMELLRRTLKADSSLGLVDLGAGLGVYTLAAVAEGRRVLAVEPLRDNYRLFHKTMQLNSGTDLVTLVIDALGESVGVGRLYYPQTSGNMGAVYVKPLPLSDVHADDVASLVKIVTLDDLLAVTSLKSAVLKLDVQGDENVVLRGGAKFFKEINIPYVFMHWLPTQNPDTLKETGSLLQHMGYEAVDDPTGRALTEQELSRDANFIVWRKKRTAWK